MRAVDGQIYGSRFCSILQLESKTQKASETSAAARNTNFSPLCTQGFLVLSHQLCEFNQLPRRKRIFVPIIDLCLVFILPIFHSHYCVSFIKPNQPLSAEITFRVDLRNLLPIDGLP